MCQVIPTPFYSNQQSSVLQELRGLKENNLSLQLENSAKLNSICEAIQQVTFQSSRAKQPTSQADAPSFDDYNNLFKKLLGLTRDARELSLQQAVLRSLYFKFILVRHRSIADAHAKTFSWLFGTEVDNKVHMTSNLARWLEYENGIYWISGKAGSGKSTLMKFLSDHSRTAELLSSWSSPQEHAAASHYFWSPGTRLQKSLEGLLRSLLFDIFRRLPDLIPTVLNDDHLYPDDDYDEGVSSRLDEGRPWSMFELGQAMDRLATCPDMPVRFCFFIDGLDEFDGDHNEVIRILGRLASSPSIKICVSSRPWNVFEDTYGTANHWKLSLQDLTQDDIHHYTESMLREHPNWKYYSSNFTAATPDLVEEITEKAQGVFLWVFLVVRSLYEGLTNEDTVSTMQERISQLPQDLEAFFKLILNSVDPFYHRHMAQTFRIALQAEEPLSIMVHSFADQCALDKRIALQCSVAPMDNYEISRRHQQMRRRLNGRCKGLLEVQADPSDIDYLGPRIGFLHRTVRDFLLTKEMSEFLDGHAQGFNSHSVIVQAHVMLLKSLPVRREHFRQGGVLRRILGEAFYYAHEAELQSQRAEMELVDELRYTIEDMSNAQGAAIPWDSFLEFAITRGLSHYLAQRQECLPGAHGVVDGSYLREALLESTKPSSDDSPDFTQVISLFLRRGANPNYGSFVTRHTHTVPPTQRNHLSVLWTEPETDVASLASTDTIWGDWFVTFCEAMVESGMNYAWAVRQKRILDLLLGHGANVNITSANGAIWAEFAQALFQLSGHLPDQRLSAVYLSMLKKLLRHGASPNAPYRGTTVSKGFFASACHMAGLRLSRPEQSKLEAEGNYPPLVPNSRRKLLAQVAEMLLRHGAHPSCVVDPSDLDFVFSSRLGGPLRDLLEAKRSEVRLSATRTLLGWIWWPWGGSGPQ